MIKNIIFLSIVVILAACAPINKKPETADQHQQHINDIKRQIVQDSTRAASVF